MIEIDGSERLGSGTIVRLAVALAALTGQPLRMINARARRDQPGLRPQHLQSVRACAELCDAEVAGLAVGTRAFEFVPRSPVRGGHFEWDIGTAGSTTMLALATLPLAALAKEPVRARIVGGVFQEFAPSPHHLEHVLAPAIGAMGAIVSVRLVRAGYVPHGQGVLEIEVLPATELTAIERLDSDPPREARGIAFASHLAERQVADRMARACEQRLHTAGVRTQIERIDDSSAVREGASLAAWTTGGGVWIGADRVGRPRRSSEGIGRWVAETLLEDLGSGATVDRHLADMLVFYGAIARGTTRYRAPSLTEHLETNLWLVERFGVRTALDDLRVTIEGLGIRAGR